MLAVLLCMGNFGMSIYAFASESVDMTIVSNAVSSDTADAGAKDATTESDSGEELLNYYEDNDPFSVPELTWRNTSNTLYTNWLNFYVYQMTPYLLDDGE